MVGQKFGRWVVLGDPDKRGKRTFWLCRCECGHEKHVRSDNLTSGDSKSCGCHMKEKLGERFTRMNFRHGLTKSPEHNAWMMAKRRCYDANNAKYPQYGGRGITMCDEWRASFEAFYRDMGPRPSKTHSLDRIDVNGNYEPSNCRWATPKEQMNNQTRSRFVEFEGERLTVAQWAERFGMDYKKLWHQLKIARAKAALSA